MRRRWCPHTPPRSGPPATGGSPVACSTRSGPGRGSPRARRRPRCWSLPKGCHLKPGLSITVAPRTSRGADRRDGRSLRGERVHPLRRGLPVRCLGQRLPLPEARRAGNGRGDALHGRGRRGTAPQGGVPGTKLQAGQWVNLAYISEGGDLVCYIDQRPVIIVRASVPTDRDLSLWTSADANFRQLQLRK